MATLRVPCNLSSGSYLLQFNGVSAFDAVNSAAIESVAIVNSLQVNILSVANAAPIIMSQSFDVDENSSAATSVGIVIASDEDANDSLSFSIISGNSGNAFFIDPNTGEIRVANSAQLDFESNPNFTLKVKVEDSGCLFDEADIHINLRDVFELTIKTGWNLISIPVAPDSSLAGALSTLNVNTFWRWHNQKFESVHELEPKLGYWVYCRQDKAVNILGSTVENKIISLTSGWNLIGPTAISPTQGNNIAVATFLASINNKVTNIWEWDDDKFKKAEFFISGRGYWAYAQANIDIQIHLP